MSRPLFKINKITPNIIQSSNTMPTIEKKQVQPKIDEFINKPNNISLNKNITRLSPIDVKFDQTINYNRPLRAYERKTNVSTTNLSPSIQKNEVPKQSFVKSLFGSKFLLLVCHLYQFYYFKHPM